MRVKYGKSRLSRVGLIPRLRHFTTGHFFFFSLSYLAPLLLTARLPPQHHVKGHSSRDYATSSLSFSCYLSILFPHIPTRFAFACSTVRFTSIILRLLVVRAPLTSSPLPRPLFVIFYHLPVKWTLIELAVAHFREPSVPDPFAKNAQLLPRVPGCPNSCLLILVKLRSHAIIHCLSCAPLTARSGARVQTFDHPTCLDFPCHSLPLRTSTN